MDMQNQDPNINTPRHSGRVYGGLFLLVIGAIFFMKQADFMFFPGWLFSWPMILIAVGIFTGLKHNFRGPGWLIPIIVGAIFLLDRMDIGLDLHRFIVPIILIGIGLTLILRPKNGGFDNWGGRGRYRRDRSGFSQKDSFVPPPPPIPGQDVPPTDFYNSGYTNQKTDFLDITSVLGSAQRIVVSKDFKGGDITCFMGGAEINLTQADIHGSVVMDITAVMGGVKLIVPPNWEVKSELSTILGGVEDKRQVQGKIIDFNKVLVLKGTAFMGGIELRSF
ncbi:MAG TPA: DUF5668 domain-containing protein [Chitinophagaceae bacterium]|nr:DUF5668 domain-containing protein [Chitinophagaceae bacterium]